MISLSSVHNFFTHLTASFGPANGVPFPPGRFTILSKVVIKLFFTLFPFRVCFCKVIIKLVLNLQRGPHLTCRAALSPGHGQSASWGIPFLKCGYRMSKRLPVPGTPSRSGLAMWLFCLRSLVFMPSETANHLIHASITTIEYIFIKMDTYRKPLVEFCPDSHPNLLIQLITV